MSKSSNRRQSDKSNSSNTKNLQKFQPIELNVPKDLLETKLMSYEFANSLFLAAEILPDIPIAKSNYVPQNMKETPQEYPKNVFQRGLLPDFFVKYDVSTLFYIFFYFPGTKFQDYAGKELILRGWKFHREFKTWFCRVSEPKEINKDYEIGEYDYFDYNSSSGWCIRRKKDFRFDYECLEPK